jgi:iron complex transport system substrate-binding protein
MVSGIKILSLFFFNLFMFNACHNLTLETEKVLPDKEFAIIKYAEGYKLYNEDGLTKLVINNPWQPGAVLYACYLVPDSVDISVLAIDLPIIRTPVKKVVCFSSTQWTGFLMLSGIGQVAGITESAYVSNELVKNRIDRGDIVEVAANGLIKNELLLSLGPDVVLYTPSQTGPENVLGQTKAGLIPWPDYFETDPLGRAEWIKVCGALLQRDNLADSLFSVVENQYSRLKQLTSELKDKPTIFADKQYSGQWFIPGGRSYVARLFEDAGANYLWADNEAKASIPVDIETVLNRASKADFWRIAHAAPDGYSYKHLADEYPLYASFKAYRDRKVIFCNTATSAYFEKGTYEPHLQLADLVWCMHPHLLSGHEPVYYKLLEDN